MVITTDTLKGSVARCHRCGGLARGGLMLTDANGDTVAWCHFSARQRLLYPELAAAVDEFEDPGPTAVPENKYKKPFKRLGVV